MKRVQREWLAHVALATLVAGVCEADSPKNQIHADWPYSTKYDEVVAADLVYQVRYEDDHVRLVEVVAFPGVHTAMHGDPYPAVIAIDSPLPKLETVLKDPDSPLNGQTSQQAPPPKGLAYPIGRTEAPIAPREFTNIDTFPLHYFKIEFKRIDGDDFATHWKQWYPWMLAPLKPFSNVNPRDPNLGPPISKEYPFAAATESYIAAPNNHYVRYQDDHVIFMQVCGRPTQRENIHGHAYPSVFAGDALFTFKESGPFPPELIQLLMGPNVPDKQNIPGMGHATTNDDWKLDPNGSNGLEGSGVCAPPTGMKWPICNTMDLQWPHAGGGTTAGCFHRIEFKRIDGEGIKNRWKEWYPWMANLAVQYKDSKAGSSVSR